MSFPKNITVLISISLCCSFSLKKDNTFSRTFEICPLYGDVRISPVKYYFNERHDSLKVDVLKFYFTNISLFAGQKLLYKDSTAHLANLADPNSMKVPVPVYGSVDELVFDLGLDSIVNTSGALGGDLDPTSGMYWAWQSGYVNFKVEGKSTLSSEKGGNFSFHLGGYVSPNKNARTLRFKLKTALDYRINMDLKKFFDECSLREQARVMSPGSDAQRLTDILVSCMSLKE